MSAKNKKPHEHPSLEEGDFYYNNDGLLVFTAQFLLKRGACCRYGCKHCPYGFNKEENSQPKPDN